MPMHAKSISLAAVVDLLEPGMTVYVPGVSGESLAFYEALKAAPERAAGVRFTGVHFPGINSTDYLNLHPGARQRAYFMQSHFRREGCARRVDLLPIDYRGVWYDLAHDVEIDLALAHVSEPGPDGMSLGLSYDFLPAVWRRAKTRVALVNPQLPRTFGSFRVQEDECDYLCMAPGAPLTFSSGEPGDDLRALARNVAGIVRDGDALQLGIGKAPSALLRELHAHKNLRIYSGMVSGDVLPLLDAGVLDPDVPIQAGVALGDAAFYSRLDRNERFYFRPVSETHDIRHISTISNFVAINAALEIDLLGQVNCYSLDGKLFAGVGGMPAFVTGARSADDGRSIFSLTATAQGAQASRIVPMLSAGSFVGSPRHALDTVATEYGVAQLRGLSTEQRAAELIRIAAPQFRDSLAEAWRAIRARF
jgi:acyl-CoA hydrolase